MFEARLIQGRILKQIIEAIKDLVQDTNIDCSDDEFQIMAMDSSHVSLVHVVLRSTGFDHYRCDRPVSLGINCGNMSKIMKCAGNDDVITVKAEDEGGSVLSLIFASPSQERIADFELKLMDIDSEQLAIPDTSYKCTIKMPSGEFQRIIRDMQILGDSLVISCSKEGVRFSVEGDMGKGNVLLRANPSDKEDEQVIIDMDEPVELTFALRYLNLFTKATGLGGSVVISMSPEVPVVVEYPIEEIGQIKYFLAPKIDEDE